MPVSRGTVLVSSLSKLSSDAQDRRNELAESLTLAEGATWEFAADYQEDHVELGSVIPTFPATKAHIPNTVPAEKINVLELLDDDNQAQYAGTPYSWIERTLAQSVVGIVILLNAIIIGLETDNRSFHWVPVEHAFLAFFVGELYCRLMLHGLGFFTHVGSVFDFFVCASGVVDIWLLPLCTLLAGGAMKKNDMLRALQMLRLLRIVRLVRLVKIIRPLYSLALGIAEALQGMVWVVVFLFMTFYAASILTARLLGLPEDTEGISQDDIEVRVLFETVLTSMFTLFESITCWSLMRFDPLFEKMPGLRIIAVLFYMLMNWALLAVLTGVVSEKIMAVKEQLRETSSLENAGETNTIAAAIDESELLLLELFRRADTDGSGSISREEFNAMLLCSDVMKPLMQQSQLDAQDLGELFDWLDHDKDGVITVGEFMQGFHLLVADIDPKGLLKLEEELRCKIQHLRGRLLRKVHTSFDNFMASVSIPLRKITAVSEQIQRLDKVLDAVRKSTDELQGKMERQSLDASERRLTRRLDELGRAVDLLEKLQQRDLVELDHSLLEDDEEMKITQAMSFGGVMKRSDQQKQDKTTPIAEEDLILFQPEEEDWRDDLSETAPDQQEFLPPGIGKASAWAEKSY
eukprot:TRINITY_DN23596_c0_g1_i1.p1 TRINITY_DN23596_c0_g1~~TRINITY_DN23596_c0_g1_i1.p1  ORF type:complete len:648 (+),score=136.14 TRINITY_DN23596_c0_g1_i1:45-1946(+)